MKSLLDWITFYDLSAGTQTLLLTIYAELPNLIRYSGGTLFSYWCPITGYDHAEIMRAAHRMNPALPWSQRLSWAWDIARNERADYYKEAPRVSPSGTKSLHEKVQTMPLNMPTWYKGLSLLHLYDGNVVFMTPKNCLAFMWYDDYRHLYYPDMQRRHDGAWVHMGMGIHYYALWEMRDLVRFMCPVAALENCTAYDVPTNLAC